jgi:uncharacterized protein YxjI
MELTMVRKWPATAETYVVTDAAGKKFATARTALVSLREAVHIHDAGGDEVATLVADVVGTGYELRLAGGETAHLQGSPPELSGQGARSTLGVGGSPSDGRFTLVDGRHTLATVQMKTFSLNPTWRIEADDRGDAIIAIGVAVGFHKSAQAAEAKMR